jgi:predicted RecB family nuclease
VELIDGRLILSATDLTGHLACERLTALNLDAARGCLTRPVVDDPELELIRRRGDEHEAGYLEHLRSQGLRVVELGRPGPGLAGLVEAEEATVAAMAAGADVIYQGTFFDGHWRGHPDFLLRIDEPCPRWPWSYEVADAKLARRVKGTAVLQTCSYSEHVSRIQGRPPTHVHVVGGDGADHPYRLADFAAYHRRVKTALEEAVLGAGAAPYPEPVEHCRYCPWAGPCEEQRRDDDHLSLVAGMRSSHVRRLAAAGVGTVAALGSSPDADVPGLQAHVFDRLHHQARLQLAQRRTGTVHHELVEPAEEGRGLGLLPEPSPGDLFFDMEGDPFVPGGGLEYLFGVVEIDGGAPRFHSFWGHDKAGEKRAFEDFVDFVIDRLDKHPDLHVYHYAAYEPSALKRLMGVHGTREREVDRLLRGGVLVDLYRVFRQGVRVSQESYSLKALEPLYMGAREGAVTDAGSSVVAYEEWLATGDPKILADIADYNRVDCESTWRLRQWLEERRAEAEGASDPVMTRPEARPGEASEAQAAAEDATDDLVARLTAGLPDDPTQRTPAQAATWLLAQLLGWHRREGRPEWWAHFARLEMSDDELLDDSGALAGLTYEGPVGEESRSVVHRYHFPAEQEHKIRPGDQVVDPRTGKGAGKVTAVDCAAGLLDLKRGRSSNAPHPGAVIPAAPIDDTPLRQSLARVGAWVADHGIDADGPYRAVRDLLLRLAPRLAGPARGSTLAWEGEAALDAARRLGLLLHHGCLPIQGPPGTGKTYAGARMILDLIAAGRRVGITATSHKAIGNLLDEVMATAAAHGVAIRALQRCPEDERCSAETVEWAPNNETVEARVAAGDVDVVAGTAWLFAREGMAGAVDVLVVEEAGQMSLANVVTLGPAAESIVLLGDPQQLAQPSKGTHPTGAGASALEHLLDGHATVPPDRGLLLDVTWRMHPDVCSFISEAFYEGRLGTHPSCGRQGVAPGPWAGGTGLRWVPVEHEGNRVTSAEEVAEVEAGVKRLLGRPWIDHRGLSRPLALDDILVVAPYNAHVARLRDALPVGARVGTVDKFQGQEAAVVVFSMATSSAEDLPRQMEFLFSLNRLNVAVSRARALAVVVCSPALLEMRCRTPEQMRRVNALCLLVDEAENRRSAPAA